MNNKTCKIIFPILTLIWMIVIFLFSSQVAEDSGNLSGSIVESLVHLFYGKKFLDYPIDLQEKILSTWSLIIRKGAHFTEFGILATFLYLSIISFKNTKFAYLYSLISTFIYACTDEFHQTFVEGRAGRIVDVLIDTSGGLFFLIIIFIINLIIYKIKQNKKTETLN